MPRSFKLPDLGEGIHEGEVVALHVAVGDAVSEGDVILEVETDKATVEIPSPFTGKVVEILVKVGDMIHVGAEMIRFDGGAESAVSASSEAPSVRSENSSGASEAPPKVSTNGPVPASPATRRLARELGVELAQVPPSGPAGLVTAEDVRRFSAQSKQTVDSPSVSKPTTQTAETPLSSSSRPLSVDLPPLPDFEKYGAVRRLPLRSIRRATAKQMSLAWSQIPHAFSQDVVDITRLETFREKHKEEVARKGGHLSFTVLTLKAAVVALKEHPFANASLDATAGEIILKEHYHIGVAVTTDEGLVVPVVRDVDQKSLMALSIELDQLAQRARNRKLAIEEMRGGTFTITNMGAVGGGMLTPIINYPEAAILGFGQARWQPVAKEKANNLREITTRLVAPMVLAIDHRILDGADAVRFINTVKQCLEDPEQLFLNMT